MLKTIEVGKLYKTDGKVVFITNIDNDRKEYSYYYLNNPEIVLSANFGYAHHWWDRVC